MDPAADWLAAFPPLQALDPAARERLRAAARIEHMPTGGRAYLEGALARGYVLRIAGTTRVQKASASGREVVLYRVGPGDTCVLTTSCLLGRKPFPAEGVAESEVTEAVVPPEVFHALMDQSAAFRAFVLGNYGDLIGELIMLLDEVMFRRLDIRLAQLLLEAGGTAGAVERTHQQLAQELGSAREAVSRLLKDLERKAWIRLGRGHIAIADAAALRRLAADGG